MWTDVITLWDQLRKEAEDTGQSLERLVRADCDVEVLLQKGPRDFAVRIATVFPENWERMATIPQCMRASISDHAPNRGLRLRVRDPDFEEIFVWFTQDLANHLYDAKSQTAPETVEEVLGKWSAAFRTSAAEGLSRQAQQGLFAELLFLDRILLEDYPESAVSGWNSQHSTHDFQIGDRAWEVKSFAGRRLEVRISGEDQLDATGLAELFLTVIALRIDEQVGISVDELVDKLTDRLGANREALLAFRTGLAKYGYIDQSSIVDMFFFTPKTLSQYCVTDSFPKLTRSDLPSSIHDVRYKLSLSALEEFLAGPLIDFKEASDGR
ncbi:PD-(D/E)XK motif protein [Lentisalinibacter salinarum]|uniref:PD-(D/E)XK motif protein n=1 Tax=Lentisalinibacter salinarum TaxID=2992239 RepID=UPI0038700F10